MPRTAVSIGSLVLLTLVALTPAFAQETVSVEYATAEVLRVVGRTVVIRNDEGEIHRYTEIPEGVGIFIDGEEATIEDLQEGTTLNAVRFVDAPAPVEVTMEEVGQLGAAEAAAPPPPPQPVYLDHAPGYERNTTLAIVLTGMIAFALVSGAYLVRD